MPALRSSGTPPDGLAVHGGLPLLPPAEGGEEAGGEVPEAAPAPAPLLAAKLSPAPAKVLRTHKLGLAELRRGRGGELGLALRWSYYYLLKVDTFTQNVDISIEIFPSRL